MAVTLTDAGEITYASFPIDKMETTPDGDLVVYGKATDGSVDSDMQIVKPEFAAKAIAEWKNTGANLRVQHNPQRDPAGIGIDVSFDGDATWVKSLVFEPVAKTLVSKGALTAYSVGIARPTIERDMTGKARGGIITGGQIVEISLVDRPANKSCGIQLVKSEGGTTVMMNEVFGEPDVIAKFTGGEVLGKSVHDAAPTEFNVPVPHDMTIDFTPNDLAKILQNKIIDRHYEDLALKAVYDAEREVYKRDVSTAERRSLASEGNALSDGSYPIANAGDLHNAAHLAATGHGNAEGAKRLIARRAKELGVANPLSSDEGSEKGESVTDASVTDQTTADVVKEAEPVITKDPADGDGPGPEDKQPSGSEPALDALPGNAGSPKTVKGKKKKAGKTTMPPWMDNPSDGGDGDDSTSKAADTEACKLDHPHTEKCMPSGTPQSASGAKDAPAMDEMPDPNAYEHSPMPAGRATPEHKGSYMTPEASAMLRFKAIGMDPDLGRLHDLTCPAFDPDEVFKYHPYSDFATLIDEGVWMRKAVEAATGPMEFALEMSKVWEAAQYLKNADMADLNDYRKELHKAFRDANPGPSSYPTPGQMSPKRFCRPVLTDGRAALSAGYGSPNTSPQVASSAPNARNFDRPPLSAGHQSPSPSHMKGGMEYPSEQGVPTKLNYAALEKENARRALSMMHDHLNHMFPSSCPMLDQDAYRQPEARDVPTPAGVGKADENPGVTKDTGAGVPTAAKSDVDVLDEIITKGRKKMLKKLGKKVMAGQMTLDEARSRVGNRMSRKTEDVLNDMVAKGTVSINDIRERLGMTPVREVQVEAPPAVPDATLKAAEPEIAKAATVDPEFIIKSAIGEALSPLLAKISEQEQQLKAHDERWEAVANLADPKTTPFSGIALNMIPKNARPAGVRTQAEIAERTQRMIRQDLYKTWRTTEDPAEREAVWTELQKFTN